MKHPLLALGFQLLAFGFCFIPAAAYPAEVSPDEAREAVQGWAAIGDALTGGARFGAADVKGVATYGGQDGIGAFHVVSFEGGGFAVTSGDTELTPILAYSEEGDFEASAENPLWVMLTRDVAGWTKKLEESSSTGFTGFTGLKAVGVASADLNPDNPAINNTRTDSANARAWSRLRGAATVEPSNRQTVKLLKAAAPGRQSSVSDLRVGPLCPTLWKQDNVGGSPCYNYYTPSNYPCGCVATAMAQIMKRFEWPTAKVSVGTGHCYRGYIKDKDGEIVEDWFMGRASDPPYYHFESYSLPSVFTGPDFGGPYDWGGMPDDPSAVSLSDAQRQALGLLCRDCGISVSMYYSPSGSGSSVSLMRKRLTDQFAYANSELLHNGTSGENLNAMISSFDLGSPCALSIPGHAVVADGYGYSNSRLYIHVNWGHTHATRTVWYAPPREGETGSDYPSINAVVYNVYTPGMCAEANRTVVSGRILDDAGAPVAGQTVAATNTTTGTGFSATSNGNGVYALLLPPNGNYAISASRDGKTATAVRNVGRCVSYDVEETYYYYAILDEAGNQSMANIPGVDLMLADENVADDWIVENAGTRALTGGRWTGEWSGGIDYESDGRAPLLGENTFTPFSASTGTVVTVDVKATLFEAQGDDAADADTQAGVRLGTNGCFQAWTGNGEWVDVSAPGVTPVDGGEYTFRLHFYYASGKYSVAVVDDAGALRFCAASGGATEFGLAAGKDRVSGVVFSGETRFTSLHGKCAAEGFAPGLRLTLEDASVVLNAAKAAYLNSIGAYTAVNGKVATLTGAEFDRAYLCNLDLSQDGAQATLALTGIRLDGGAIEIDATLTRTHPMGNGGTPAPINGVIRFYGARALAAFGDPNAAPLAVTSLANGDFSGGDTASAVFAPGENVFFKAKIGER